MLLVHFLVELKKKDARVSRRAATMVTFRKLAIYRAGEDCFEILVVGIAEIIKELIR